MGDRRILTYIDSDVLMAAWLGEDEIAQQAFEVIDDPNRIFASSLYSKLELLPKPTFYRKSDAIRFYEGFFSNVSIWADIAHILVEEAIAEASKNDLTPIDALHIAAAASMDVDEFITGEKATKPMHRTKLVSVRTIRK